jgi:hypothetical protein
VEKDAGQVEAHADAALVPSLRRRIAGVLLEPVATFEQLDASWGWLGPWLAVAGVGILAGIIHQARSDVAATMAALQQHQMELMPEATRRLIERAPEEQRQIGPKLQVFFAKIADFAGPTLGAILAILVVGGILFGASYLLGGKRYLLRSIVIAAHAKLVAIVSYSVVAFAALLGNPLPSTSLVHATDELRHPVAGAFLSGLDPIAFWHSYLLFLGLACALGVKTSRAIAFVVAFHGGLWLLAIGGAAIGAAMGGMG